MRLVAVLLAAALPVAGASDLFSWHSFEVRVASRGRLEVTLHTRARTRHELRSYDLSQVGPLVRWAATDRVALVGSFYFRPQRTHPGVWIWGRRSFFGVEAPILKKPGNTVTSRVLVDRLIGTGRPDHNRYRALVRWTIGRGLVRPFVQHETLAARTGFHSTRQSGGLTVQISEQLSMDASYVYDTRRTFWGGDRQAIVTSVRWKPRTRAR